MIACKQQDELGTSFREICAIMNSVCSNFEIREHLEPI